MAKAGVTAVLNVQTEIDIVHRGVNWGRMVELYSKHGIKAVHFPIHDFNEQDLRDKIYKGAKELNTLVNTERLEVYVHCTAGMGRAPAVAVTYFIVFLGMDPDEADAYVKSHRPVAVPNMRVVKEVVEQHRT